LAENINNGITNSQNIKRFFTHNNPLKMQISPDLKPNAGEEQDSFRVFRG